MILCKTNSGHQLYEQNDYRPNFHIYRRSGENCRCIGGLWVNGSRLKFREAYKHKPTANTTAYLPVSSFSFYLKIGILIFKKRLRNVRN